MEEAVEERGHGGGIAEELAPVVDRAVRGQDRRGAFVAAHDELEENLDEGAMWPTSFALKDLTPATEAKIGALVKKAVR